MTVISITVTDSAEQIVSGIPKIVSISTNIPTSIFYTLNGIDPTLLSTVYTGPIIMPTNSLNVILKILATDGIVTSSIVVESYLTNMVGGTNVRFPHAATDAQAGSTTPDLYPFGTPPYQPNQTFLSTAEAGITVDNPALPETGTGFDGAGNPTGFTNKPYNLTNYSVKYSTTDFEGQTGKGIGNLPATVDVKSETPVPETSNQNSNMFDPRALVIYQDASTEGPNDPIHINRMSFNMQNDDKARDGANLLATGLESPALSGSFLRSHYNSRTNEVTHYYYDSIANRWIISKAPFNPSGAISNFGGMVSAGGGNGSKYVYEWVPFARRVLF